MGRSFPVFFVKREAKRKLFNLVYTNPALAVYFVLMNWDWAVILRVRSRHDWKTTLSYSAWLLWIRISDILLGF